MLFYVILQSRIATRRTLCLPNCGGVNDFGTRPQILHFVISGLSLVCTELVQSSSDEYPSSPKFRVTVRGEVGGLFVSA